MPLARAPAGRDDDGNGPCQALRHPASTDVGLRGLLIAHVEILRVTLLVRAQSHARVRSAEPLRRFAVCCREMSWPRGGSATALDGPEVFSLAMYRYPVLLCTGTHLH